ncbi:MAG TPA: hypothetical protein VFN37_01340 [Candidatus Baltobacteraceae bacterium]|nr:hypothetical protein [Candidatus Baltobacteraceae bacterium]
MTINEQLQFSVLTAPVAALDRRALSQAWYSALYGSGKGTGAMKAAGPIACAQTAAAPPLSPDAARFPYADAERVAAPPASAAGTLCTEAAPQDRRAPRSTLARKIERAFLRPHSRSRKTSFTVEGDHGRVHVLLQSSGSQFKLIAVCAPKARPHVAAALAQARYALAMRGIDLDAAARSLAGC